MKSDTSRKMLVARSLIALAVALSFLAAGAPVAADTGVDATASNDPVETNPGSTTCDVYSDVNPTAGAGARCEETVKTVEDLFRGA